MTHKIDINDIGIFKELSFSWSSSRKIDFCSWFLDTLEFLKNKNDVKVWLDFPENYKSIITYTKCYYGEIPYRMSIFGDILSGENILKLDACYVPNGEDK
jgi:hypothetical protein